MSNDRFLYDPMPAKMHSFDCQRAICDCPVVESASLSVTPPQIGSDVHEMSIGPEISMFIDFGNGLEKVTCQDGALKIEPVDWFGGR